MSAILHNFKRIRDGVEALPLNWVECVISHDVSVQIYYFTLPFAAQIGLDSYVQIARGYPATSYLVGEWIFASSLFDIAFPKPEVYLHKVIQDYRRIFINETDSASQDEMIEGFIENVLNVRNKAESFLDACLENVIDDHPPIVGFTSVFQQQIASLALAKRIKAHMPETVIVFGGANCEGVMGAEIIRQFTFVDAVVSGEGDLIFPQMVKRILAGQSLEDLQGVYTRVNAATNAEKKIFTTAPLVRELDTLPYPDYTDFFQQVQSYYDSRFPLRLLFETSRGCWWGEKQHCTFCGLNGATLTYRSKSASRALAELLHLTATYPGAPVSVVDNILDMKYFKDFLPELAKRQLKVELFYEVKANLRKEQVRLLSEAGVKTLQPGIESFSTPILKLMRKGVKGLQNIQLLKWCKEFGLIPYWNLLWGFPGEPQEEYIRMTSLLPLLNHLPPPVEIGPIRLDRFSPNFDQAELFGFVNVRPCSSYHEIYPFPPNVLTNLAYYFTYDYHDIRDIASYTRPITEQVRAWKKNFSTSDLFSVSKGIYLLIWDLRPIAQHPLTVASGLSKALYVFCDGMQSLSQMQKLVYKQYREILSVQEIVTLLQPFIDRGLMISEEDFYLSLAIPLEVYSPTVPVLEQFRVVIESLGGASGSKWVIPLPGRINEGT